MKTSTSRSRFSAYWSLGLSILVSLMAAGGVMAAAGELDSSFGTNGKVVTDFNMSDDYGNDIVVESNGKIIAIGCTTSSLGRDFALARYNNNGSIDTSFGIEGKVTTDFQGDNDCAQAVAIQADGKVVAAGYSRSAISNDAFAVARYNSDGSLDATFGIGGKVITPVIESSEGEAVIIQPDGKIIVAGLIFGSQNEFALVRYNSNGSLDTSFDGDGKVTTNFDNGLAWGHAVALQGDGKIVVAGEVIWQTAPNQATYDFALTRYNSDGSLDPTFNGDGRVVTDIRGMTEQAYAVAIQSDGKIIAAGYGMKDVYFTGDFALVRYTANGSLDNTFGDNGKVITQFSIQEFSASDIVIQPDGKIIVAGTGRNDSNQDFALARYNANGSLDTDFDNDGKVTTTIGNGDDWGTAVAIQSGNSIIVGGWSYNGSNNDFALARYYLKSPTFTDVPSTYWAYGYIERLYAASITGGCGTGTYCPEDTVTRAQMAVFLERGKHGSSYDPPPATGLFTDVPTNYWAANWIEQLSRDGITGGCAASLYCPESPVTRAQMAVFLLKAEHGSPYSPPAATGLFTDVPTSYWAAKWIEQLSREGITGGCGAGTYCPEDSVTRAQMAVFLVKTFSLP